MANDFDTAWAGSWSDRATSMAESAQLDGTAVTVIVLDLNRRERIGRDGGRDADVAGEIEMSRADWISAQGTAGSILLLRGVEYEIEDDPTDSDDASTVVLSLGTVGGN